MKYTSLLICVLPALLFGCLEKPENLCPAVLIGKVVSRHPPCAGIVVEVSRAPIPEEYVDEMYTDDYGNTFYNAFTIANMCELDEADLEWLSAEENVGVEFAFYLYGPSIDELCTFCKPLVTLTERKNKIGLAKENCVDQQHQQN